jgi:hypothetical protein
MTIRPDDMPALKELEFPYDGRRRADVPRIRLALLLAIYEAGGPITADDAGERIGLPSPHYRHGLRLSWLERRGYVSGAGRRAHHLKLWRLTPSGERLLRKSHLTSKL